MSSVCYPPDLVNTFLSVICSEKGVFRSEDFAEKVRRLFDFAYLASFSTDESSSVSFRLIFDLGEFLGSGNTSQDRGSFLEFDTPREMTVGELTKLSSAISLSTDGLVVSFSNDDIRGCGFSIIGISKLGSVEESFYNAISDLKDDNCFELLVTKPGSILIQQGARTICQLNSGVVTKETGQEEVFNFLREWSKPSSPWLKLVDGNIEDSQNRDMRSFYLWVIFEIFREVEILNHGAIIILTASGGDCIPECIQFKYGLNSTALKDAVRNFYKYCSKTSFHSGGDRVGEALLGVVLDEVRSLARLSVVDGAIVLSEELEIFGFGGEIVSSLDFVLHKESSKEELVKIKYDQYGMRHRAGFRYAVERPADAVIVFSEDGGGKFVRCIDGVQKGVKFFEFGAV